MTLGCDISENRGRDLPMHSTNQNSANTRLHVLEMATWFTVGGIPRHIMALATFLRENGHRVSMAGTPGVWVNSENEAAFIDLPIRHVTDDGGAMPARLVRLARAVWILRRWLRKNRVDLIHAHESAPAWVAHLARVGLNIPMAITYHGADAKRIPAFARIASRCDLVISPSRSSADDLAKIGGVSRALLKVIGLGVRPAPPDSAADIAALRRELLGDGERLVITIARLDYQKGIDILIDCVARMALTHPSYRFAVAGDGCQADKLRILARRKGVQDHLRFLGSVSRPHLYLRASDLFLLTSRWEALPFSIVEAFQAGTPAIATACSGVVELIDDTVGAAVPIGDIGAICAAVTGILSDEPRRAAMGAAALKRSQEDRFDPETVHRQFEQTYYALTGRMVAGAAHS